MESLQFSIPPLPRIITAGHAVWQPGIRHFQRSFDVFDMLFVRSGKLYMTEQDTAYEIDRDEMLLLEPGKCHWGHRECAEETELFWVHFKHDLPVEKVDHERISWNYALQKGTETDLEPVEQIMYVPKFAAVDPSSIYPILESMIDVQSRLTVRNALQLHSLLGELLVRLQSLLQTGQLSRSQSLSDEIVFYLHRNMTRPFDSKQLERVFHFQSDYLSRCLKRHTGMSPVQYLHHIQMEKAKLLLQHTYQSIQDIGAEVGQSNYNYFVRLFRKKVGVSPKSYRESREGCVC